MSLAPQRRREDRVSRHILNFLRRFFTLVGIAATISLFFMALTVERMLNYEPSALPEKILLTHTFKPGLKETAGRPSLDQPLLRPATTLGEIITAINDAAKDTRVIGFAAKMEDIDFSTAQVQELRGAVEKLRAAGKFAYVFSDSFGGFSSGMGDYYLASSFGQIWLQPVGIVAINGVAAEVPFLKEALDKIGVEAQFGHKGKYKSMPESLMATGMSAPHREMMTALVGDLAAQIQEGIAVGRKLDAAQVKKLVDEAPFTDQAALAAGLVDKIGYYDQMLAAAKEQVAGKDTEPVNLLRYGLAGGSGGADKGMASFISRFTRKEPLLHGQGGTKKIALVFGVGNIVPYSRSSKGGFGEGGMAADKITEAFRAVQKDDDVAAVVLRLDSPGGSPTAAETIRRAVTETREKGKPVVVSMGSSAASGGYWIATGADKIIAQPGTLTGSIGVFGGKLVLKKLWEKLGVTWEGIAEGKNARMWSSGKPFSGEEFANFEGVLDNIYEAFLARVMESRKMTHEEANAVAEGRVWTGRQAKEKRLVDELGGLDTAVAAAKTLAGLDPAEDIPVVRFPKQKSTLELFISLAATGALFSPSLDIMEALKIAETDYLQMQDIRIY